MHSSHPLVGVGHRSATEQEGGFLLFLPVLSAPGLATLEQRSDRLRQKTGKALIQGGLRGFHDRFTEHCDPSFPLPDQHGLVACFAWIIGTLVDGSITVLETGFRIELTDTQTQGLCLEAEVGILTPEG